LRAAALTRIEATPAAVAKWTDHVKALGEGLLMNEIDSWIQGYLVALPVPRRPRAARRRQRAVAAATAAR